MSDPLCVRGCGRESLYDIPEDLCEAHWVEWWVDGLEPKTPEERAALVAETLDVIHNGVRVNEEPVISKDQHTLRDLLLRPTDLEPGMYTAQNEDGTSYAFSVCCHVDGKTYEMVWCVAGGGAVQRREGDLLFQGVYMSGMRVEYPKDGPVEAVDMDFAQGYRTL